ncbi:MAG TPA: VOC family protein [Candidatus Corynebacterium avicola]|uniref:VOC family protein n=1 Tax=Candidatus Corynebacterium avicola TaxID=2838527 RepID=A0A9D1RPS1_9CORY|nr:VOC family protein [Candidatus Corynebacterium avicola]
MNRPLTFKDPVFAIDCPDAPALADFYARLLGWTITSPPDDTEWVEVHPPKGTGFGFALAFQQVDQYRAPEWPEGQVPQQAHLDFHVDSLEESGELAVAAGAVRHEVQPSESGSFVVYSDPAGHLFCLCQAQ